MKNILTDKKYYLLTFFIIIFGGFLRLKCFLLNPSMWHDECALGWNIYSKNYSDFFGVLDFTQMAPPFFLILAKVITNIVSFSDLSLRIIPFMGGCFSVLAFYFLAQTTLGKKPATIWAVLLFAINIKLIDYSVEFKPYSTDVLLCILCLIFFTKLNLEKIDYKKVLLFGAIVASAAWFSFTSAFVITAGIIVLLVGARKKSNIKKIACFLLPIIIGALLYFKFYLMTNLHNEPMFDYWQKIFITDPRFFAYLFYENVKYLFSIPQAYIPILLSLLGVIKLIKEKNEFTKISLMIFMLTIAAFFLKVYPFLERMILFLLPIFILFMAKAIDYISKDKKIISSLLFIILTFFTITQVLPTFKIINQTIYKTVENPRKLFDFMMKNIKPNEIICVNKASDTELAYYSIFYKTDNKIIKNCAPNKLKKGNYWLFMPYYERNKPEFNEIGSWLKKQNIIKVYKEGISQLFYIHIP